MKIFDDEKLENQVSLIHFGKVEVGQEKIKTLFLLNDSTAILSNLVFLFPFLPHTEVLEMVNIPPVTIQPNQVVKLVLKWKPSASFKKALSVELMIKGEEIYLAPV